MEHRYAMWHVGEGRGLVNSEILGECPRGRLWYRGHDRGVVLRGKARLSATHGRRGRIVARKGQRCRRGWASGGFGGWPGWAEHGLPHLPVFDGEHIYIAHCTPKTSNIWETLGVQQARPGADSSQEGCNTSTGAVPLSSSRVQWVAKGGLLGSVRFATAAGDVISQGRIGGSEQGLGGDAARASMQHRRSATEIVQSGTANLGHG